MTVVITWNTRGEIRTLEKGLQENFPSLCLPTNQTERDFKDTLFTKLQNDLTKLDSVSMTHSEHALTFRSLASYI